MKHLRKRKETGMEIHGFNKLTLLDYPGHIGCTLFTGRCNFRCPFCQNASLVMAPDTQPLIAEEEVLSVLKKRRGVLEGVCITGGEPTLQPDLPEFLKQIKDLGFLIKLDTNGYLPDVLEQMIEDKLIDYAAMDLKNCRRRYAETAGIKAINLEQIERSVSLLMERAPEKGIEYEFRTTAVKEFHTEEDLAEAGTWIRGAAAWYLQAFKDSGDLICRDLTGYSKEEMHRLAAVISPYASITGLRGID